MGHSRLQVHCQGSKQLSLFISPVELGGCSRPPFLCLTYLLSQERGLLALPASNAGEHAMCASIIELLLTFATQARALLKDVVVDGLIAQPADLFKRLSLCAPFFDYHHRSRTP